MCQPQSAGGRRCIRHQAATKSAVHYTWAKTKVDKETIYGILKELNKEGRKLDAPELAEVNAFLDKEVFKTKLDPDLSERDKRMILKNLEKARLEAENQGVTGGAFHAVKNLFSKTIERIKKPLLAIGLTGVLAFTVVGCSGNLDKTPIDEIPDPPTTSVECSTENAGPWGDAVAQEIVKDEFGEYCKLTVDPNSSALKFDASKVDMEALKEAGFTEADAEAAQQTAVKFLTEQALDSTRLDNSNEAPDVWFTKNSSYFEPSNVALMTPYIKEKGLSPYSLIVTDVLPAPLARDGGPRASSINIQVNSIAVNKADGNAEPSLLVSTSATVVYPASNSYIVETILKNDSSQTEEALQASSPQLFNEETNVDLMVSGTFNYAFFKENPSLISGTAAKWTVNTTEGLSIVE